MNLDKLYVDIGVKIKKLAKWTFIVEAVVAALSGLVLMVEDEDTMALGLLIVLAGPLVAWVSSWLLYGFGELVDKACDIERNTRKELN